MAPTSFSSSGSLFSPVLSLEPVTSAQRGKPSLSPSPKLRTDLASPASKEEDQMLTKIQKRSGRKFTDMEPASKRIAQNRIAQRLHRERKQKQVQDLEEQVKRLTAIVAAYESVSGPPPSAAAKAASLSQEESSEPPVVQQLSAKILLLQAENNLLKACFAQLGHGAKAPASMMTDAGLSSLPVSDGTGSLQDFSLFSGVDRDSPFLAGSAAVNQASLLQPWFSPATSVHSDVALFEEFGLQQL
ncbi:hypothetical protein BC830DRAFT_1153089 [Chytriomyces sp. MP71]|nr:hypothetical protein BC830DRAFT_1153089 [Chytriomyces sp. MP71]